MNRLTNIVCRLTATLYALFACCHVAAAQEAECTDLPELNVSNYQQLATDNGLSSNTVNVIFRDQSGLMWFGTEDGLNSFDGYSITSYLPSRTDTLSIEGKQIFELAELEPNVITVAMGDGGLNTYNKATRTFNHSPYIYNLPKFDTETAFGTIKVQDQLLTVYPECVIRYDMRQKMASRIESPKKYERVGVNYGKVRMRVMPGGNGDVAILSGTRSVSIINVKNESMQERRFDNTLIIYDACPQDPNTLLLGTSGGLAICNIRSGEVKMSPLLKGEAVQVVSRNDDGDIWIAYNGNKLLKWLPSQNKVQRIANSESFFNRRTKVNDIYEDENDLVWVATNNSGVVKLDVKPPKISSNNITNTLPRDYNTFDISNFNTKELWAACGVNGFVRANLQTGEGECFIAPHCNVLSILARRSGEVLLGTSRGVYRFETDKRKLYHIEMVDAEGKSFGRVLVRQLTEDCLGNVWVACQFGLLRYNGVCFEQVNTEDGERHVFNCVMEDSEGRMWAGSCSGAFVKDINETTFRHIGKRWTGCNEQGVVCIAEYGRQVLMGSSDGVMAFDKRTAMPSSVEYCDMFQSKMVYSIVCDRNGILWLNTSMGIGYIDVVYGNVYIFDRADGLVLEGNECRRFSLVDDIIYFGQAACVNTINTQEISFNTRKPKTFVSDILYGRSGRSVSMEMVNDSTYAQQYQINASTKIRVASSDYTLPKRNRFMYRVDHGEWFEIDGTNEVDLSGLMPGTYRIQFRSTNSDNNWSYNVKSVYLRMDPPLWLSHPALIFYTVLLMSIVWMFLNARFRSLNRRMRLAEAEAKSKTIVEDQRNRLAHVISEQNASFNYAKRIQDALMPKVQLFQQYFVKLFVLYRPKEIVSGDFYTFYHRDGLTFVVASDCTGHGVPGAFISILGIDHLNYIIMEQKVNDAGEILTKLHAELHNAVKKISTDEINDGMDITVCVIDHENKRVNFAGAMNDLYIIRNNEVFEYRGNRMSVGTNMSMDEDDEAQHVYTSQDIECQSGDMMYLFSDGYMDQFGGPEHKKFKVRRFKNLLLNVHKLPSTDQKILLNQKFEEWRGAVEQTDDVSIVGFEPWA